MNVRPLALLRAGRTADLLAPVVGIAIGLACLRLVWSSLHDAVVAIDHGDLLFADFVHHYYPTVAGSLRHGHPAGGFFYPAGFAVLIAPIGWLPLPSAIVVWSIVQLACWLWVGTALVPIAARGRPWLVAIGAIVTVTSIPILHDLKWGQVSLPILVAVGGAFVAHAKDRRNVAALLLGIAAGIKGYPLVFVGWFLVRGDIRFVLRAAVGCAIALFVLPAVFMGPEHALFFQRVSSGAVLGAADGVLRDFNSQYAPAVLARLYDGGWDGAPPDVLAWAKLGSIAALTMIALLVIVAARSSARAIAVRRDLLGLVLLASSVPFWLRTSWSHYFVHLPVAQTMLVSAFWRGRRATDALAIAVFVVPSVFLSNVLGLIATDGWWYYANAGSLFFANALVLCGTAAFVGDAHLREGSSIVAHAWSALGRRAPPPRPR